ncbi:thiamine pyrophosphokinase-related protein [Leptodontidium sp. MPI-SDFR-AT-0119]|nr:thiamine pyrophosphokinase-related protein [Leptodontidium sp. MPI-SDFR-AT-0119]
MKTILDIVKERDNFPYQNIHTSEENVLNTEDLWIFLLPGDPRPHGYIESSTVKAMPWTEDFQLIHSSTHKRVQLIADTTIAANEAISEVLQTAREKKLFNCLKGWRNEEYRILGARSDIKVERAGAGLFGIITIGVHMTVFTRLKSTGEIRIWVPTRSMTTTTYPGMLDSSVAGGVPVGVEPFECLVKEAAEEASLSEDLTRQNAKSVGCVSEFCAKDDGQLEPSVKYVYDMEIEEGVQPRPADSEVQEFRLTPVDEVKKNILGGMYKPMSAMVIIDFLVRHGILNVGNEKDYSEVVARTHRLLPFPTSPDKTTGKTEGES